jgi:hypothetical protein
MMTGRLQPDRAPKNARHGVERIRRRRTQAATNVEFVVI